MANTSKERQQIKLTSAVSEFFKTARVLNDKKYMNEEKKFKKEMVKAENQLRRQESQTLNDLQNVRIEGIVI